MKKRLTCIIAAIITVICVCFIPVTANTEKAVYDKANILTNEEISMINSAAKEHFSDKNCSVYIVTSPYGTSYRGEDFLDDHPEVSRDSVILILACNSLNNYDMYTYGKCDRLISYSEVDIILDDPDVYDNIKYYDDYVTASIRFIELSADACTPKTGGAIVLGIVVGLTVALIIFISVTVSYNKKQRSEKYPLERFTRLELNVSRDDFAGSFITKRVISSNRSSGGGSRGGGGGGGHRGGR